MRVLFALIFIQLFSNLLFSLPEIPEVNFSVYCDRYYISSSEIPCTITCHILNTGNVEDMYEIKDYCNNNSFIACENFSITFSALHASQCPLKVISLARPDLIKTITFYFESNKVGSSSAHSSSGFTLILNNYSKQKVTNISSFKTNGNTSFSVLKSRRDNLSNFSLPTLNNRSIPLGFGNKTQKQLPSGKLTAPLFYKLLFIVFIIFFLLILVIVVKRKFLLMLFFIFVFVFAFPCYSFKCDVGSLSSVCIVNSAQDVSGENIVANKLIIESGGKLYTKPETFVNISVADIIINGSINANVNINAVNIIINREGELNASGKGIYNYYYNWVGQTNSRGNPLNYSEYRYPNSFGKIWINGGWGATGGIVRIYADNLIINGSILANGYADPYADQYAVDAGCIYINVSSLMGHGIIQANEAIKYWHGQGGGMVAIYYDVMNFSGTIEAKGYKVGTIYLKPKSGLATLILDGKKQNVEGTTSIKMNETLKNLVIVNGSKFKLKKGSLLNIEEFNGDDKNLIIYANTSVTIAGKLIFPTASNLIIFRGAILEVNSSNIITKRGSFSFSDSVINGTLTTLVGVPLIINSDVVIVNGKIDATGKGYSCFSPGLDTVSRGKYHNYSSYKDPREFGRVIISNAGSGDSGGIIRINTENLTLNGDILSNGKVDSAVLNYAISGGSIYINTSMFFGVGTIQARGISRNIHPAEGGIVSIYYDNTTFEGNIDVSSDRAGVIYLKDKRAKGILITDNNGTFSDYDTELSTNECFLSVIVANGSKLKLENSNLSSKFIGIGNYSIIFENSKVSVYNSSINFSAENSNISLYSTYANYFLSNSSVYTYWKLMIRTNLNSSKLQIFDNRGNLIANSSKIRNFSVLFGNRNYVYVLESIENENSVLTKNPYTIVIGNYSLPVYLIRDRSINIFNCNNSVSGSLPVMANISLYQFEDFYDVVFEGINKKPVRSAHGNFFIFKNLVPGMYFLFAKSGNKIYYSDIFEVNCNSNVNIAEFRMATENRLINEIENITQSLMDKNTIYLGNIIKSAYQDILVTEEDRKEFWDSFLSLISCLVKVVTGSIPSYVYCIEDTKGVLAEKSIVLLVKTWAKRNYDNTKCFLLLPKGKELPNKLKDSVCYVNWRNKMKYEKINFSINLSENDILELGKIVEQEKKQIEGKSFLPYGYVVTPKQNLRNVLKEKEYNDSYFGLKRVKDVAGTAEILFSGGNILSLLLVKYGDGSLKIIGIVGLVVCRVGATVAKTVELSTLSAMTVTFTNALIEWPNSLEEDYNFFKDNLDFLNEWKSEDIKNISGKITEINITPDLEVMGRKVLLADKPEDSIIKLFAEKNVNLTVYSNTSFNISAKLFSVSSSISESPKINISYNQTKYINVPIMTNFNFNTLLSPKPVTFVLMLGPKIVDIKQEFVFVIPKASLEILEKRLGITGKIVKKAIKSTWHSYLFPILLDPDDNQKEFNITYLPNITKLAEMKFSRNLTEYEFFYTFHKNLSKVKFLLVNTPAINADLHVYCNGKHVGYNYSSGKDEINIGNASYSGRENLTEIVEIPAKFNNCILRIKLAYIKDKEAKAELYVIEIPKRPAILAFSPFILESFIKPNELKTLSMTFAEIGCEEDLGNISLNAISNSLDINISLKTFNLSKCENKMVNISLKLKDNITLNYDRLNVYEGKLIINSSIGIENVSIRVFVFPKVLKKGWNLISLPFDIGIRKAEDLLALLPNCTSKVLIEWNGNNSYRILKGDENINYTKSYFVYSCKNQTWYLEGFERNETKLTIKKGWNFISLPLPIDYNTSRFEFNCSGEVYNFSEAESKGIVSDVFSFNERKEAWNATNSIIPGKGFLLYANESCILSYKR